MIHIRQTKTNKPVRMPVFTTVKRILKKYDGNVPQYSDDKYNQYIKEVYKKIDPHGKIEKRVGDEVVQVLIHEEISSHDMVRTFINWAHRKDIPVDDIAIIVGKTVKVVLSNYLEVDHDKAMESFKKIDI